MALLHCIYIKTKVKSDHDLSESRLFFSQHLVFWMKIKDV